MIPRTCTPYPMATTGAERQQAWRDRQRAGVEAMAPCTGAGCKRLSTGRHGSLCSICWRKVTPEGRAWWAMLAREQRAKGKRQGVDATVTDGL